MSMRRDVKCANQALLAVGVTELMVTRVWRDADQITLWLSATHKADKRLVEQNADRLVGTIFGYSHVWEVRREGHGFIVTGGHVDKSELVKAMEHARASRTLIGQRPIAHRVARIDIDGQLADPGLGPYHYLPERLHRRAPQLMCESGIADAVAFWQASGLARETSTADGTVVDCPTLIAVREERDGIAVAIRMVPGQGLPHWQKALSMLRSQLNEHRLTVEQIKPDVVSVSWHDLDPFAALSSALDQPRPYDTARDRSPLGVASSGTEAFIPWKNNPGMVGAGMGGSGKTGSLMGVFAGLAGYAEMHVFDGKGGEDMIPLKPAAAHFDNESELEPFVEHVEGLVELMKTRMRGMRAWTGESNFWAASYEKRAALGLHPVFLIVDECQTFYSDQGLEKDEKVLVSRARKAVRTLIQKGRAAGFVTINITQKPESSSIPTIIRDTSPLRIAFRLKDPGAVGVILPSLSDDDASPAQIPETARGRCVIEVEGEGHQLVQTYFVPELTAVEVLAHAPRVPDQLAVAKRLGGSHTPTPEPPTVDMSKPEPVEHTAPEPTPFIPPTTPTTGTPNLFG